MNPPTVRHGRLYLDPRRPVHPGRRLRCCPAGAVAIDADVDRECLNHDPRNKAWLPIVWAARAQLTWRPAAKTVPVVTLALNVVQTTALMTGFQATLTAAKALLPRDAKPADDFAVLLVPVDASQPSRWTTLADLRQMLGRGEPVVVPRTVQVMYFPVHRVPYGKHVDPSTTTPALCPTMRAYAALRCQARRIAHDRVHRRRRVPGSGQPVRGP